MSRLLEPISGAGVDIAVVKESKERSFYYWELVILYRKVGLIVLVYFGSFVQFSFQLNLILVFLILHLLVQTWSKPFFSKIMNDLEYYSIFIILIIIYTGVVETGFDR